MRTAGAALARDLRGRHQRRQCFLAEPCSSGASVSVAPGASTSRSTPFLQLAVETEAETVHERLGGRVRADHGKAPRLLRAGQDDAGLVRARSRAALVQQQQRRLALTLNIDSSVARDAEPNAPLSPKPALLTTSPMSRSAAAVTPGRRRSPRRDRHNHVRLRPARRLSSPRARPAARVAARPAARWPAPRELARKLLADTDDAPVTAPRDRSSRGSQRLAT